jgi:hypothetical protein
MFEASHWFGINNWVSAEVPINTTDTVAFRNKLPSFNVVRHYGDLDIFGFTLNLQVDF